jgi:hypothetical protein
MSATYFVKVNKTIVFSGSFHEACRAAVALSRTLPFVKVLNQERQLSVAYGYGSVLSKRLRDRIND